MRIFAHEDVWKQPALDRAVQSLIAQQGIERAQKVNELILQFSLGEINHPTEESTNNLQS